MSEARRRVRVFYAVEDHFPPWRVDLVELFSRQLPQRNVQVEWSFQRAEAGRCRRVAFQGQVAHVPVGCGYANALARLTSHLAARLCDVWLFAYWLCGPRFDILQVRDRRYLAALLAWIAARVRGMQFVYWLSFPFPENCMETANSAHGALRWSARVRGVISGRFVYRFLMRRADHVFVQSEQMLEHVARFNVRRDKLTAVPMGVAPELAARSKLQGVEVVPGLVVYLGTFARGRRLELLIDAFSHVLRRVPHATLAMVGKGDEPAERRALEERASRLGIAEAISFTGFLPSDQAWNWAARAEVCVSPLFPTPVLNMGSPTKLVEYLALGKAVVATDHPDQTRVITESGAGLCVGWSVDAFADAIVHLLTNRELAARVAAGGPSWVRRHRSYDVLADLVVTTYERLKDAS